mmetsp:Transcript_56569/g.100593  ORF Transcript_56569/g.100593 Transcript_56569/m.100593 type:complete len:121 (+) Transcript_56569:366-728(+)
MRIDAGMDGAKFFAKSTTQDSSACQSANVHDGEDKARGPEDGSHRRKKARADLVELTPKKEHSDKAKKPEYPQHSRNRHLHINLTPHCEGSNVLPSRTKDDKRIHHVDGLPPGEEGEPIG